MAISNPLSPALSAASTKVLILAILDRRPHSYGYEIIQIVKSASGGRLDWKDGMLYPVLHRMEREGLIASFWGVSDAGRKRKYYRIREAGKAALQREMNDWTSVYNILQRVWTPQPGLT